MPTRTIKADTAAPEPSRESRTAERLVEIALAAWETRGHAGMSARAIAQGAGQPVSSIYYHFADLERLLLSSQMRAIAIAQDWCDRRLAAIPAKLAPASEALPPLLAALIADWSVGHRPLAFAWRECQLVALRNDQYRPALTAWDRLWADFWAEICARCSVPDLARLTHYLFDGESFLHLIRGNALLDAACLTEVCQGWGAWLAGRPAPEGPWRRHARTEAARTATQPEARGDVAERIALAAADLVTRHGPAGLTHRAVAAEAGLTLGAISYHCRTSVELMEIAFERIYRRGMGRGLEPVSDYAVYRDMVLEEEDASDTMMSRLAMNELLVAVARDETLQGFAAQLRYLRGRTSRHFLTALFGAPDAHSPLEAALFSNVTFGMGRSHSVLDRDARRAALHRDSGEIEALLRATRRSD